MINPSALVSNFFFTRHSGKSYNSTKPVDKALIEAVCLACSRAFSSFNLQPYECIFFIRSINPIPFNKALNSVFGTHPKTWIEKAPILILFIERTLYSHKDSKKNTYIKEGEINPHHSFDTGAAAMSLALQADILGLMAHPIGGFNHETIRKDFNIPTDKNPRILMTLGYEEKNPEEAKSERNPLDNNFFVGDLNSPISKYLNY